MKILFINTPSPPKWLITHLKRAGTNVGAVVLLTYDPKTNLLAMLCAMKWLHVNSHNNPPYDTMTAGDRKEILSFHCKNVNSLAKNCLLFGKPTDSLLAQATKVKFINTDSTDAEEIFCAWAGIS